MPDKLSGLSCSWTNQTLLETAPGLQSDKRCRYRVDPHHSYRSLERDAKPVLRASNMSCDIDGMFISLSRTHESSL